MPDDEIAYFYLGNWFTDYSQGIAPVDFASGQEAVRAKGLQAGHIPIPIFGLPIERWVVEGWVNTYTKKLLGNPPPKDSAMARFFWDLSYCAGWWKFCSEQNHRLQEDAPVALIPFDEYDRLFKKRYTQYFPHEHLDRWPIDRVGKSRLGRRLYDYLEADLIYVSELLTLVDRDWASVYVNKDDAAPQPPSAGDAKKRHDALVEFGHAIHAVEDFFAHSNFAEFAMRSINKTPSDNEDWLRIFERRLKKEKKPRVETYDHNSGNPLPSGPTEPETDVVTGYFDSLDTRFSLAGLYEGLRAEMDEMLQQAQPLGAGGQEKLGLMDYRKAKSQQELDVYKTRYTTLLGLLGAPDEVKKACLDLIQTDWSLGDDWRWRGKGVSYVLEQMVDEGKDDALKVMKNKKRRRVEGSIRQPGALCRAHRFAYIACKR